MKRKIVSYWALVTFIVPLGILVMIALAVLFSVAIPIIGVFVAMKEFFDFCFYQYKNLYSSFYKNAKKLIANVFEDAPSLN